MTNPDFLTAVTKCQRTQTELLHKLLTVTRSAVHLLKDLKMDSSADALAQIIFEYDAAAQELMKVADADPSGFAQSLLDHIKRTEP